MKPLVPLVLVAAAMLSACSRPVVRETVVERQVPVPAAAPVVTAAAPLNACSYASQGYSHGSIACQADRAEYRCDNGAWRPTYRAC